MESIEWRWCKSIEAWRRLISRTISEDDAKYILVWRRRLIMRMSNMKDDVRDDNYVM